MNADRIIARLEIFPHVLRALVASLAEEDARFKPAPEVWSIHEIVCHLAEEETLDFRSRVERTLHDAAQAWEPIDPEGWAREKGYVEWDLGETLAKFEQERAESVRWLRFLVNPDWSRAHEHPKLGTITAGSLLTAWCAHDALHLRQIAKRLFELARRDGAPYSTGYAGEW